MKVIDVYKQYFSADCVFNGVARRGALVTLTATSDNGRICYEVSLSFFPHTAPDDFSVSYDAYASKILYDEKGRRSKKREAGLLPLVPGTADELAAQLGGVIHWDTPLTEARMG